MYKLPYLYIPTLDYKYKKPYACKFFSHYVIYFTILRLTSLLSPSCIMHPDKYWCIYFWRGNSTDNDE